MRIIKLFDYLSGHSKLRTGSLLGISALLICLVFSLHFSEDISDFLPLGTKEREALSVYQNISGANNLVVLFSNPDDTDMTIEAIDRFAQLLEQNDRNSWCKDIRYQFDMENIQEIAAYAYEHMPYFLSDADYRRMDSLLAIPGYIPEQLARDRQMLMFPTGGMVTSSVVSDPLALYSPVMGKLSASNRELNFEIIDGYIFTPDLSRAIALMDSPFGNSETEHNTELVALLDNAAAQMHSEFPEVSAHVIGGAAIAVGNSSRIKTDSIIAIALSAVLIILLLIYSFGSLRNILLIFLSIGWGGLFALGGMAIFRDSVSIIVIGISSVILGIAVNYPLHLIAHTGHQSNIRSAISEIFAPLVVGNITTVGAFLALVPLQSHALRDLGLFASLLLVGTILFTLVYLPHFIKTTRSKEHRHKLLDRMAEFSPEKHTALVAAVAALSTVLVYFSFKTEFDTNLSHINYMTAEQRADMQYFENLLSSSGSSSAQSVYVLSSGSDFEQALEKNAAVAPVIDSLLDAGLVESSRGVSQFIVSKEEQQRRLRMWNDFASRHSEQLGSEFKAAAKECGFSEHAFDAFLSSLEAYPDAQPQELSFFAPLTDIVFAQSFTTLEETKRSYVIDVLSVEKENMAAVKACFDDCFDVQSTNSALSDTLSDNFNYIGWACSLIVFFFLWFSFGRFELALISFLPMAISWVWILGLMALFGIKFNIVNIILATFIFGQGDDYTIFMTEGCQYEYTHRRPILASYKSSILQSALIMFVGIGTLIVAKHPAMQSLAQVTIIGMASVVLMAYMIPPLCFNWLTTKKGQPRQYPLTFKSLFKEPQSPSEKVRYRYIYKGKNISRTVERRLKAESSRISAMPTGETVCFEDEGCGELALLLALTHPDTKVTAMLPDEERKRIAEVSAEGFANNIEFMVKAQ